MIFRVFGWTIQAGMTIHKDELTIGLGLRIRKNYWQKLEIALALGVFIISFEQEK